jgi:hypothetical protein
MKVTRYLRDHRMGCEKLLETKNKCPFSNRIDDVDDDDDDDDFLFCKITMISNCTVSATIISAHKCKISESCPSPLN